MILLTWKQPKKPKMGQNFKIFQISPHSRRVDLGILWMSPPHSWVCPIYWWRNGVLTPHRGGDIENWPFPSCFHWKSRVLLWFLTEKREFLKIREFSRNRAKDKKLRLFILYATKKSLGQNSTVARLWVRVNRNVTMAGYHGPWPIWRPLHWFPR